MPLCTSCAYPAEHLYTTYSSKSNIRLGVCVSEARSASLQRELTEQTRCGNFLDPLIEHPPLLLILDLILLKPRVYLHLLFNRGHPPKDGSRDAVPTPEPGASRDLWSDWALLSFATIASESATRLIAGRRTSHLTGSEVVRLVVLVIFELVAQHLATTAVALLALRLKGWHRRSAKAASSDGRQRHFEWVSLKASQYHELTVFKAYHDLAHAAIYNPPSTCPATRPRYLVHSRHAWSIRYWIRESRSRMARRLTALPLNASSGCDDLRFEGIMESHRSNMGRH